MYFPLVFPCSIMKKRESEGKTAMPNLYKVSGYIPGTKEFYEVYVFEEDAKHAERLVRLSFPYELSKAKLKTVAVDMKQKRVLLFRTRYDPE